jgi:hypothetical protein
LVFVIEGITMKRTTAILAAVALFAVCSTVYALYEVSDRGEWPQSWPQELERLRRTSRTLVGPMVAQQHFEIPFSKREDFESAWPHLLKVKSKGAPIFLVRKTYFFEVKPAGVLIHAPPVGNDKRVNPEAPIPAQSNPRTRWMNTTFIELVVDGNIVDLNRIALPEETPIIDERFTAPKDGDQERR